MSNEMNLFLHTLVVGMCCNCLHLPGVGCRRSCHRIPFSPGMGRYQLYGPLSGLRGGVGFERAAAPCAKVRIRCTALHAWLLTFTGSAGLGRGLGSSRVPTGWAMGTLMTAPVLLSVAVLGRRTCSTAVAAPAEAGATYSASAPGLPVVPCHPSHACTVHPCILPSR